MVTHWMPLGRLPVHKRMTQTRHAQPDPPTTFTFGPERVLDGIAVLVNARAATREG